MHFSFRTSLVLFVFCWLNNGPAAAQVERVWLSHQTHDSSKVVVSFTTKTPGDAVVRYGLSTAYDQSVRIEGNTTLHHVEIAIPKKDVVYHYSVGSGSHQTPDATFKGYPTDALRVAVVADWQGKPNLQALLDDNVHLLLTAGDNISNLRTPCGNGNKDCIVPYAALIDAYPELFRSIPFMPALGNHDREIRPRGPAPPAEPVYDIDATAFRRFFALPGDEWKWYFDVPEFDVRFVALDLSHISDQGTTWQSCHAFQKATPQYAWYDRITASRDRRFLVTLYNAQNASVRAQQRATWNTMIRRGSLAISGFGYFAERASVDGLPFYNTALNGHGSSYPDPHSAFFKHEDSYLLLSFAKDRPTVRVELKNLKGNVLDRQEVRRRLP